MHVDKYIFKSNNSGGHWNHTVVRFNITEIMLKSFFNFQDAFHYIFFSVPFLCLFS